MLKRVCILTVGVFAIVAAAPAVSAAYPMFTPSACSWHVIPSPNAVTDGNDLYAVTAISPTDAWAGGYYVTGGVDQPLFEHWNGTTWTVVPGPNPGYSFIYSMTAIATNDVWAVGAVFDTTHSVYFNLSEHWDGTAWSIVGVPDNGYVNNFLYGVSATSSINIVTVGAYNKMPSVRKTQVGIWNTGGSWLLGPGPDKGTGTNVLTGVAMITPINAWAVGIYSVGTIPQTLAEHYNGTKWKVVATPDVNSNNNLLNAVSAVSAKDVWAVGDYYNGSVFQTLAENYNGTSWSIVSSPSMGTESTAVFASTVVSKTDVWAGGEGYGSTFGAPFSMNWNGTAWSAVTTPSVGPNDSWINGMGKVPGTKNVWAVGGTSNSDHSINQTMILEFHC